MTEQVSSTRRLLIKGILAACLLSFSRVGFTALAQIVAVRVWPSSTYTRITLESNSSLSYRYFVLHNPERLVIDIDNLNLNTTLRNINQKVMLSDPFIQKLRVAQRSANSVRLVVDLKNSIKPSIFTLKPVSEFKHRLVIDLYPQHNKVVTDEDPLLALLEQFNQGDLKTESKKVPPPVKRDNRLVIVLDPGHGGEDSGAVGYRKTKEKDIVLQIARRLRNLIKKEKNMLVYMTRDEDVFIPLRVRVAKARALHADLFISIHADAFTRRDARGSSVFALSTKGASSSAASYLAQTQNEADQIGGVSRSGDRYLDHTLLDLVQTTTIGNSLTLGHEILSQMKRVNRLHKSRVEQAGFAVLKAPDIPSVLVETAFISNPTEERKLRTAAFQNEIAQAILKGVKGYLKRRRI